MNKSLLYFLFIATSCSNGYAAEVQKRITINAELALNTCALTLSPTNVNFQEVSLSQLENNAATPQTVSLDIDCSWPASGVSFKFSPAKGVSTSAANLMKTGLSGVGLELFWKNNGSTDFVSTDFSKTISPTVTTLSEKQTTLGQFQLLPKKIPEEKLQAGNISTTLTVEVTYE